MKRASIRLPICAGCALAGLAMMGAACDGDESEPLVGAGGSSTTGTAGAGGATGGSTGGTAGGATGGAAGGTSAGGASAGGTSAGGTSAGGTEAGGTTAAGGAGGAGGAEPDPLAGEYSHECLPSSPECLGGWVCKAGSCSFCADDAECANDDCNTTTFRCAAHDLCAVEGDCPSNSFCDGGACVYDHPAQGTCGLDALYYAHDQFTFTPTYAARLSGAVSCVVAEINGGATLTLDAFADLIGGDAYSLALTQSRGNALRSYLINHGASAGSISVVAHGSQLSTGIYEADRAADRRVELNWN